MRRPTREELLRFLADSPSPRKIGKRDVARAFGLSKHDSEWIGERLRELAAEGAIETRSSSRRVKPGVQMPSVAVLQVLEVSKDGDVMAAPGEWRSEGPAPRVRVIPSHAVPAPGVGDRLLARLKTEEDGTITARPMRLLESGPGEVLGVFELIAGEGRIVPASKKDRDEYRVRGADAGNAKPGEVVLADVVGRAGGMGMLRAKVKERIGDIADPRTLSLIAIHQHGIPTRFSPAALKEADDAAVPELGRRTDFRETPLITIDPVDARDFDDAVYAEPDTSAQNPGGWKIVVAVADVSHYVRPGTALDRDARERGNSTYFPDRVVPMLPHVLSGGVCSLRPGEERACLVATIWLDADGKQLRHTFDRGLMRSAMRLTYEQAQKIHDHGGDPPAERLLEPIWGAWESLMKARRERKPLEIVSPELVVRLGADGHVADVHPRTHLDAHQVIEEFMIAANVAAAVELGRTKLPIMYRVHDEPEPERIENLRNFLATLGHKLAAGQRLTPSHFNQVLAKVKDTPHEPIVNQLVLRTQAQAVYSPERRGHFGLALQHYVHFTSPIRRYSDLLVHRAMITAKHFGPDGLADTDPVAFEAAAQHISTTERRSMMAERDANDRYLAAFLSSKVGGLFAARISGVTTAGLFVTLIETGASALIPMRSLGDERFHLDEQNHRVIGDRSRLVLQLGDVIEVKLLEAVAASGGLLAGLESGGEVDTGAKLPEPRARYGKPRPGSRPAPGKGGPPKGVRRGRSRR